MTSEKRMNDMLNAIQMYNLISELENDISMGCSAPEGLNMDLMNDTKNKCLEIIYQDDDGFDEFMARANRLEEPVYIKGVDY